MSISSTHKRSTDNQLPLFASLDTEEVHINDADGGGRWWGFEWRSWRRTSTGDNDGGGSDAIERQTVSEERKSAIGKTETTIADRVGEKAVGGLTTRGPSISKMCAQAGKISNGGIAGFAGEDNARAFDFQNAHLEEEDFQNTIGVISSLVR
ncbi:hypothetical protein ACLOJK_000221 [Asimina triloba]